MGLFSFLKKNKKIIEDLPTENPIGPTHLEGLTTEIGFSSKIKPREWKKKLTLPSGQTKFNIKYYGNLHSKYKNLIVASDFAPILLVAVDIETGKEYLLFDGCKHGYNALFCDTYTIDQVEKRTLNTLYTNSDNGSVFEIIISTTYSINYEAEFREEVTELGTIETVNGAFIDFESAKQNGFDSIQIWVKNKDGKLIEIVSEELA